MLFSTYDEKSGDDQNFPVYDNGCPSSEKMIRDYLYWYFSHII